MSFSQFFSKKHVQTDATTPNIVGPTMLEVVASEWCANKLGHAVHRGKDKF